MELFFGVPALAFPWGKVPPKGADEGTFSINGIPHPASPGASLPLLSRCARHFPLTGGIGLSQGGQGGHAGPPLRVTTGRNFRRGGPMWPPGLSLRLAFGQPPPSSEGGFFCGGVLLGPLAEKPQWGPCRHVGAHLCVRPARPYGATMALIRRSPQSLPAQSQIAVAK